MGFLDTLNGTIIPNVNNRPLPLNRDEMLKMCGGLRNLFLSGDLPAECPKSAHLQNIASIHRKLGSVPDVELPEVRGDLDELLRRLMCTDAGDGDVILSTPRWKKFLEWEP